MVLVHLGSNDDKGTILASLSEHTAALSKKQPKSKQCIECSQGKSIPRRADANPVVMLAD